MIQGLVRDDFRSDLPLAGIWSGFCFIGRLGLFCLFSFSFSRSMIPQQRSNWPRHVGRLQEGWVGLSVTLSYCISARGSFFLKSPRFFCLSLSIQPTPCHSLYFSSCERSYILHRQEGGWEFRQFSSCRVSDSFPFLLGNDGFLLFNRIDLLLGVASPILRGRSR